MPPTGTPRSPKRRRIANASSVTKPRAPIFSKSTRYSSPDELAGSSDHERYKRKVTTSTPRENAQRKRLSTYDEEDTHDERHERARNRAHDVDRESSPDELDHSVHTFYRTHSNRGSLSGSGANSRIGIEGSGRDSRSISRKQSEEEEARDDDESIEDHHVKDQGQSIETTPDNEVEEDERMAEPDDEDMHTPRETTTVSPEPDGRHEEPAEFEQPYRTYKLKMILKGHRKGVACVKFSPNGKFIASCSADATIRIWDTSTGKQLHRMEGHLAGISTIAWAPDSQTLASGSDDKSIRLWNTSTGLAYPTPLLGHHNYIYSIAFSPKGNMLVSGSYDEAVFLWDVRGARVMRSLPAHSDPVGGVDFIRDGTLIVSCGGDGLIRIWDTATGQCLRTLVHTDSPPVTSVKFSPNGKFVLAWTLDSCIRLWNYVEGRCVKTYQGHVNTKYSTAGSFGMYGADQAFAVSGSEDGGVVFWDVTSKEVLQRIDVAHEGVVLGIDTKDGMVISCGVDKVIRIWEVDGLQDTSEEVEWGAADVPPSREGEREDEIMVDT